jgi:hypothetical protein
LILVTALCLSSVSAGCNSKETSSGAVKPVKDERETPMPPAKALNAPISISTGATYTGTIFTLSNAIAYTLPPVTPKEDLSASKVSIYENDRARTLICYNCIVEYKLATGKLTIVVNPEEGSQSKNGVYRESVSLNRVARGGGGLRFTMDGRKIDKFDMLIRNLGMAALEKALESLKITDTNKDVLEVSKVTQEAGHVMPEGDFVKADANKDVLEGKVQVMKLRVSKACQAANAVVAKEDLAEGISQKVGVCGG